MRSIHFWSPDSQSIGFFAFGKLYRIGIAGGAPQALADAPQGRGGAEPDSCAQTAAQFLQITRNFIRNTRNLPHLSALWPDSAKTGFKIPFDTRRGEGLSFATSAYGVYA